MTPAEAQLQFGAEFLGFLAATSGVALSALRGVRRRPPLLLAASLVLLAGAAFAAGVQVARDGPGVALPRGLGALGLVVGAAMWDVDKRVRALVWSASAALLAAVPLAAAGPQLATDAAVAVGSLLLGAAVVDVARRSVASRVAVTGSASLLVVLLVLAVALSAVLDRNLRNRQHEQLEVRAAAASGSINLEIVNLVLVAQPVAANVVLSVGQQRLVAAAQRRQPDDAVNAALAPQGEVGRVLPQGRAYLFLAPDGSLLGQTSSLVGLPRSALVQLVGSNVVSASTCQRPQNDIQVVEGKAYAVVALAACAADARTLLGRLVAVLALDDARFVQSREVRPVSGTSRFEPSVALLTPEGKVVAADGARPPDADLVELATATKRDGEVASRTVGSWSVAAAPVKRNRLTSPELVVVTATPTDVLSDTRQELFRVLFAIGLGGALIALLLAAAVGERIGSRLRRLTDAAEALGRGEPGVRVAMGGGDEVGVLGSTFDAMAWSIQASAAAEARLRGRIEAVVAGMGEALVATDAEARITDFNSAAEELVGLSATTAVGRQVTEVLQLTAEDGTDLAARLKRPPRTRWTASASLVPLDGPVVPVAVSGAPLRDAAGDTAGGVVVLRDLRGEREVERMKTEFLSRIGHELRTPLTGVLGYSEMLLRREWPPERARTMLQEVNASGHRLERIVELLEFFAGSAAGRPMLRLEPLDLRTVVDDVVRAWEPKVAPPTTVVRKVGRAVPKVLGDPRWLRAALNELVDNAVKFSPAGGRIVLSVGRADDGRVEVVVADRGVGMSADEVERAFTAFEQGDTSDTRRYGGLGLGLPLVLRVAEGHGGEVRCATTPGRGTRLAVLLPSR